VAEKLRAVYFWKTTAGFFRWNYGAKNSPHDAKSKGWIALLDSQHGG